MRQLFISLLILFFFSIKGISQEFEWVVQPQFDKVGDFDWKSGLANVKAQNHKWGYINQSSQWVIQPQFNEAGEFDWKSGLARVEAQNNKWGYIDKTGQWIIQPQFEDAKNFDDNFDFARVKKNERWGCIDKIGQWIIQPQFSYISNFETVTGLAPAKTEDKWGYIDRTGQWKIQPKYELVDEFDGETRLAAVKKEVPGYNNVETHDYKWGYIDDGGNIEIEPKFDAADKFDNCNGNRSSWAVASQNDKWGYISQNGEWEIEPKFEAAYNFDESGFAEVKLSKDGDYKYIDDKGNLVADPDIEYLSQKGNSEYLIGKKDRKVGFLDFYGHWIIQPQFGNVKGFKSGYAAVEVNWKWGFISLPSLESRIKKEVEQKINQWQKKGEFEKSVDYQNRVSDQTRNAKIREFEKDAMERYKEEYAEKISWNELELSDYDADHETYLIKSSKLGDFAIPVPIAEAPSFKKNWSDMKFTNPDFSVSNGKFVLAKLILTNPSTGKNFYYDSKQPTTYCINKITYNFAPVDITLPQNQTVQNGTKIVTNSAEVGISDVDLNIPTDKSSINPHAYALIIGNEDYSSFQPGLSAEVNVAYAANDAQIFKKYCIETLGIPVENTEILINATGLPMAHSIERINKIIKKEEGEAEIVFYYAGHGLPDEQTHESFIMPVDASGQDLLGAIKLKDLYSKLTEFPTKKVTVFLDACFSGGGRGQGLIAARDVKIRPKTDLLKGNIVVFSSSSGEQSSLPYKEKKHGMFTYFLLKKIQETKGQIVYNDLYEYLKKQVDLNCLNTSDAFTFKNNL